MLDFIDNGLCGESRQIVLISNRGETKKILIKKSLLKFYIKQPDYSAKNYQSPAFIKNFQSRTVCRKKFYIFSLHKAIHASFDKFIVHFITRDF